MFQLSNFAAYCFGLLYYICFMGFVWTCVNSTLDRFPKYVNYCFVWFVCKKKSTTLVVQRLIFPIEAASKWDISQSQPEVIIQCRMKWVFPSIRIPRGCRLKQVMVRGENYKKHGIEKSRHLVCAFNQIKQQYGNIPNFCSNKASLKSYKRNWVSNHSWGMGWHMLTPINM